MLEELPRTNNSVESWHNVFTTNEKNLNINALVEKMRLEQLIIENNYTLITSGHIFEIDIDQVKTDKRIFNVVSLYSKDDCLQYLKNIILNAIN